jgi:hypothetical protein
MAKPYEIDFPDLVQPPMANYYQTLVSNGLSNYDAALEILTMDVLVRDIVFFIQQPNELGFAAPETTDSRRVYERIDTVNLSKLGFRNDQVLACIHQAIPVLRGEVAVPEFWPDRSDAYSSDA